MSPKLKHQFIDDELDKRKTNKRFRTLKSVKPAADAVTITKNGRELINFCSNDYLGLSKNPQVIQGAKEHVQKYGAGSTASRLITGTYDIHNDLEAKIAETFKTEAALLFNSGYQANSTIIETITDRHALVLADKLSHNSLLQGSLSSRADLQRFNHNDLEDLEKLLKRAQKGTYSRILIVTETVFSMDGDRTDVRVIAGLAEKYNALLFVDDAHAVGVWGEKGLGLGYEVAGIDILLGTCGKAFGSFGAYVACSKKMRDYLVNFCPGFIYTTALPPAVIGAIDSAIDLIPKLESERKLYHEKISGVLNTLKDLGYNTGPSSTQIIPLIIGPEDECLELAEWLETQGILATAIRPPTVPKNSSRIRITLTLKHTEEHIEYLLTKLKEWKDGRN